MIAKIKLGKLHIRGVLRHRFEKQKDPLERYGSWRKWELGLWFKRYKAVGEKNFIDIAKWNQNFANVFMIGINLLIVKAWIEVDYGAKHF